MADRERAQDRAHVVEDGEIRRGQRGKPVHGAQKVGVKVLRPVREASNRRHERDQIHKHLFVLPQRARHRAKTRWPVAAPRLRLRRQQRQQHNRRRQQQSAEKNPLPTQARHDDRHGRRGQQVSGGIARLQDAAEQAAPTARRALDHERRANAPITAHAHTIERAQNQECAVAGRERRHRRNHRKEQHARNERSAPSVAVGERAQHQRAQRTRDQRDRDGPDDGGLANGEARGQRIEKKNEDEKEIGIENPSQDSRRHGELPSRRARRFGGSISQSSLRRQPASRVRF